MRLEYQYTALLLQVKLVKSNARFYSTFVHNQFYVYQFDKILLFLLIIILGCHYAMLIGIIHAR